LKKRQCGKIKFVFDLEIFKGNLYKIKLGFKGQPLLLSNIHKDRQRGD